MSTRRLRASAHLCARAILQHPRRIPGHPTAVVFDALIRSTETFHGSDLICCSFRYARDWPFATFHPGVYDVYVKIVQFRPNVHIPSPHRIDEDYDLMGDILELRPLPQNIDVESASSFPARICTSGRVISVQTDIHTFTMIVRQVVVGTESCVRLRIRGLLGREPFWPRATPFLPAPHSLVAFTGNLVAFRGGVAVVALDDMTFLPFDFSYDEYGFADVESDLL